jgi:putative endonuclease
MYKNFWVYIVMCSDDSYYTGVTNDIERRIWEHNNDIDEKHYTFKKRPVELVFCELHYDIYQAIDREKQIKRWSRLKKKALIEENYDNLIKYSQRKYPNR